MLNLSEFGHNHHPSRVKLLAKNIKRGFSVYLLETRAVRQGPISGHVINE
jgi:hypothetical protein